MHWSRRTLVLAVVCKQDSSQNLFVLVAFPERTICGFLIMFSISCCSACKTLLSIFSGNRYFPTARNFIRCNYILQHLQHLNSNVACDVKIVQEAKGSKFLFQNFGTFPIHSLKKGNLEHTSNVHIFIRSNNYNKVER